MSASERQLTRRELIQQLGTLTATLLAGSGCRHSRPSATPGAAIGAPGYDPTKHKWLIAIEVERCIGCGFCVQACPYGCRFLDPMTKTAEKCTLCYHRITRGLLPACVEVCPTHARVFGDVKAPGADSPIPKFIEEHKVQVLKPHLGTSPRVLYAGLDGVVR